MGKSVCYRFEVSNRYPNIHSEAPRHLVTYAEVSMFTPFAINQLYPVVKAKYIVDVVCTVQLSCIILLASKAVNTIIIVVVDGFLQ